MKLPYREGTWFALPLRQGGYAVGLVARSTTKGKVILCYFFGPRLKLVPILGDIEQLKPGDAIRVVQVGDLGLIRGQWPVIGQATMWNRSEWPMPQFVRRCPLSRRAWRVFRSDTDPAVVESEEPEPYESTLESDGLHGAGSAEILLTKLLNDDVPQ